jgi:uncharacterized FAD-dependent dehydrogenase
VTEENREEMSESLKKCSLNERRIIEYNFFETAKKNQLKQSNKVLYVIDVNWVI